MPLLARLYGLYLLFQLGNYFNPTKWNYRNNVIIFVMCRWNMKPLRRVPSRLHVRWTLNLDVATHDSHDSWAQHALFYDIWFVFLHSKLQFRSHNELTHTVRPSEFIWSIWVCMPFVRKMPKFLALETLKTGWTKTNMERKQTWNEKISANKQDFRIVLQQKCTTWMFSLN